jgi:hypothetical protein
MAEPNVMPRPWIWRVIFFPVKVLWALVTWIVNLTGLLLGLILGLALMAVGFLLTSFVVTAFLGVPLFILGFFITLRALY